jgi:hypothetical protein
MLFSTVKLRGPTANQRGDAEPTSCAMYYWWPALSRMLHRHVCMAAPWRTKKKRPKKVDGKAGVDSQQSVNSPPVDTPVALDAEHTFETRNCYDVCNGSVTDKTP